MDVLIPAAGLASRAFRLRRPRPGGFLARQATFRDRFSARSPEERRGRAITLSVLAVGLALVVVGAASCHRRLDPAPPGLPGHETAPVIRVRLSGGAVTTATIHTTGAYRLRRGTTVVAEGYSALSPVDVRRSGGLWHVNSAAYAGGELIVEAVGAGSVGFGRKPYRGKLRLVAAGPDRMSVVNHLDVESYLAGVLANELYGDWDLAAYEALAVAARTFALYHLTTASEQSTFDLAADTSAQVYRGLDSETDKSRLAVANTFGVVLAAGPAGDERIFLAHYSACCGGRVNPVEVLRDAEDTEPFRGGQHCDDCRRCRYYRWPDVAVPRHEVYQALVARWPKARGLGGLAKLRVKKATGWGRPIMVEAVGTGGKTFTVRAETLRHALRRRYRSAPQVKRLRSMNCTLRTHGELVIFADGRGHGHGVGLCQWGAQGKARKGWTARQILEFYYPGAKRFRVY